MPLEKIFVSGLIILNHHRGITDIVDEMAGVAEKLAVPGAELDAPFVTVGQYFEDFGQNAILSGLGINVFSIVQQAHDKELQVNGNSPNKASFYQRRNLAVGLAFLQC